LFLTLPTDACPAVQLKIVTLQKLFNVVEEEYSPSRLCFRKPATLPMDHEPAMLSLAPREMWQQLLICELPTCAFVFFFVPLHGLRPACDYVMRDSARGWGCSSVQRPKASLLYSLSDACKKPMGSRVCVPTKTSCARLHPRSLPFQ
jgi:hypothetical protein